MRPTFPLLFSRNLLLRFQTQFFYPRSFYQNRIDEALISIKKNNGHLSAIYANRRRKASRIVNAWMNQKRKKKERKKEKDTVDTGGRPSDYFQGWPRRWMYLADLSASAALRLHRPKASQVSDDLCCAMLQMQKSRRRPL